MREPKSTLDEVNTKEHKMIDKIICEAFGIEDYNLAIIQEAKRRKRFRVLKVLEYNHVKLAKPLTNRQLNKILTAHSIAPDNEEQEDLFNHQTKTAR
jgi:hypothetical protein